jgi:hypothetical protein
VPSIHWATDSAEMFYGVGIRPRTICRIVFGLQHGMAIPTKGLYPSWTWPVS